MGEWTNSVSFAQQVLAKRQQEGHSLRSLGQLLGVSFSTIARIERGESIKEQHVARKLQAWLHPELGVIPCHCSRGRRLFFFL